MMRSAVKIDSMRENRELEERHTVMVKESLGKREISRPPAYSDSPGGFIHNGVLSVQEQDILKKALDAARLSFGKVWAESSARKEIFWVNIWQRTGGQPPLSFEGLPQGLDCWARDLALRTYCDTEIELDGYGFISNPIGSKSQKWHVDYSNAYSTIFIPLTRVTPENATQYCILPPDAPAEGFLL